MLKTYQFKAHCKGDSHSSKTANIILPDLVRKFFFLCPAFKHLARWPSGMMSSRLQVRMFNDSFRFIFLPQLTSYVPLMICSSLSVHYCHLVNRLTYSLKVSDDHMIYQTYFQNVQKYCTIYIKNIGQNVCNVFIPFERTATF